jgi:hypothetical protein
LTILNGDTDCSRIKQLRNGYLEWLRYRDRLASSNGTNSAQQILGHETATTVFGFGHAETEFSGCRDKQSAFELHAMLLT